MSLFKINLIDSNFYDFEMIDTSYNSCFKTGCQNWCILLKIIYILKQIYIYFLISHNLNPSDLNYFLTIQIKQTAAYDAADFE